MEPTLAVDDMLRVDVCSPGEVASTLSDPTIYQVALQQQATIPLTKYLAHLERVRQGGEAVANDIAVARHILHKVEEIAHTHNLRNCLSSTRDVQRVFQTICSKDILHQHRFSSFFNATVVCIK